MMKLFLLCMIYNHAHLCPNSCSALHFNHTIFPPIETQQKQIIYKKQKNEKKQNNITQKLNIKGNYLQKIKDET